MNEFDRDERERVEAMLLSVASAPVPDAQASWQSFAARLPDRSPSLRSRLLSWTRRPLAIAFATGALGTGAAYAAGLQPHEVVVSAVEGVARLIGSKESTHSDTDDDQAVVATGNDVSVPTEAAGIESDQSEASDDTDNDRHVDDIEDGFAVSGRLENEGSDDTGAQSGDGDDESQDSGPGSTNSGSGFSESDSGSGTSGSGSDSSGSGSDSSGSGSGDSSSSGDGDGTATTTDNSGPGSGDDDVDVDDDIDDVDDVDDVVDDPDDDSSGSGSGSGSDSDDNSGSGSGSDSDDNSGSGSGSDSDDNSGSGSGSDSDDNSGSGSGDGEPDDSEEPDAPVSRRL